jgi:hypothetical protein
MRLIPASRCTTVESIFAAIARSQIIVPNPYRTVSSLPPGFDFVDIAVLDWIAAEDRRLGRALLAM